MSTTPCFNRWITAGLLASTVLALAAPAFADGRRRYKGVQSSPVQRVYVRERSSSAGPILAGLVGGFLLGAAVTSHAQSGPVYHEQRYDDEPYYEPRPSYRYYDPYGDDWYDSLNQYNFRYSSGPRVVFVIDVRSGHRLRALRYHHGRWNRCDDSEFSYDGGRRYRYQGYGRDRRDRDDDDRRYRSRDDDDRRHGRGHRRGNSDDD